MNGFTRKKVKSMTLGERLYGMRKERRISLREISRDTRIQIKYLEALEKGDYSKLPPPVYVKGFLRSYADFFGVKHSYLLKPYDREMGIQDNLNKKEDSSKTKKKNIRIISGFAITPKFLTIIVAVVMIVGGLAYLYHELDNFISVPRLVIINPTDKAIIERSQVYVQGLTDPDGEVFINDQPTLVNDKGEFNDNVSLQNGVNVIKIRSVNRFNKETVKTLKVNANFKTDIQHVDAPSESYLNQEDNNASGLKVEISVHDDPVWISVESDGELIYSGTLLPQVSQEFESNEEIKITSGKGNSTFVKVNGKDIGTLSEDSGIVRDVTFTAGTKY